MVIVYGSTGCANCKTLLSMAKAQGIEVTYKLIDQDEEALREMQAHYTRPNLPVVKHIREGGHFCSVVTQGLPAAISLLKTIKSNQA